MDKSQQEEAINALKNKKATQPCPRCLNVHFDVVGDTWIPLATDSGFRRFSSPLQVPVILASCTTCGYIALHAKGVLGLKRA